MLASAGDDGRVRAGASHFGVADLAALARDTHKFESRYLDGLVGPVPGGAPTLRRALAAHPRQGSRRRSSCSRASRTRWCRRPRPRLIVAALPRTGVPHAVPAFPGEQHGFRIAENIITAVESELAFYGRVFGFRPAGDVRELDIVFAEKLPG